MSELTLYFRHGWGFSADFWTDILADIKQRNFPVSLGDAGYFGSAQPDFPKGKFVAITHSLGLMEILPEISQMENCAGILGINSFACFAKKENFPEGVDPRILKQMQRGLLRNPAKTLQDFYALCGAETPPAQNRPYHIEALKSGLDILLQEDRRILFTHLCRQRKILGMLSGKEDPLAPAAQEWISEQTIIEGGHLLPLTHSSFCATWIFKKLPF